jgi:hypothetical protein
MLSYNSDFLLLIFICFLSKKTNFGIQGATNKIETIRNFVRCRNPVPKFPVDSP